MLHPHNLQPRRAPEPYRPFVNRQAELQFIADKLCPAHQGDLMPMVVTCFWGAFGIGKSWLLGELERRYRRSGPQVHGSYPTIAARLDLHPLVSPVLWQDGKLDLSHVVQELWKQLAPQVSIGVPDLGQVGAADWAEAFIKQVTTWLAYATPVLMLDTLDAVVRNDEAAFFWLEEHLVEQLALTDRVLFIFASRGELRRWRRFQVRRRVDSYPLAAFDAETAGREVKANPAVSRALYHHAFGHPLATEYLGSILEKQGINLEMADEGKATAAMEPSLVQAVLNEVTTQILEKVSDPLAQLARQASVLRWVNVEPLRHLAEALGLAESGRGDAYYLDLIGQLQAYHLLYWNVDTASYESAPTLRRLLAHTLELDDPSRFCAAHLAAYAYHRKHLEEYPQYLARYVPEAAYHYATLVRDCSQSPGEIPVFAVWWEQFLDSQAPQDAEPWDELVEALEKDAELRAVLPAEGYERLCSEAREHAAVARSHLDREE